MADLNANENLIWSIKNGDLEAVRKHLENNPSCLNELVKGRAYLHYACDYGQLEILEYLVQKGANINLRDKYEIVPILAAIWEDHEKCVNFLLKKGADRQVKSPDGKTLAECTDNEKIKALLR